MSRKGKRTRGMEKAHPFAGMSRINPNAAGIDIGAVEIVVCVPGDGDTQIVRAFGNYTADLQAIGKWLKEHEVETVAMESTGVYWIPLFEELERQGVDRDLARRTSFCVEAINGNVCLLYSADPGL